MPALVLLLAAALALLALGAAGRRMPRGPAAVAGLGAAASGAALLLPPALLVVGPSFAVDGWSAVPLLGLFLLAAVGTVRPAAAGALALVFLAGDGAVLVLALAAAALLSGSAAPRLPGPAPAHAALLGLAALVAVGVLGGLDPRFADWGRGVHAVSGGAWGAALAVSTVLAAGLAALLIPVGGGLASVYLVGRLLLQLPGTVTPGWWGGPVLVLGAAVALAAARRSAASPVLDRAVADAGLSTHGIALMALGAALLARGADLLPLAALSVSGAALLLLAWGIWAALLALCAAAVPEAAGAGLKRMGGLLRRAPATGLAALVGFLSAAAVPLSPGFAALWLVAEALMGAGRSGGTGGLLLLAGGLSALGTAAALLAAAAARLAGLVLLGPPRSTRAAAVAEPPRAARLFMAVLVAATALLGLVPTLGLQAVRGAAAAVLANEAPNGPAWLSLGLPDVPGYPAPLLALLLLLGLAGSVAAARGPAAVAAPWTGGFIEDGVGRGNAVPLDGVRPFARPRAGTAVLLALAVLLAALAGWAAR